MKIRIGREDAHHRLSSGKSMTFHAGKEYDAVPVSIAKALEKAGKAESITSVNSNKG